MILWPSLSDLAKNLSKSDNGRFFGDFFFEYITKTKHNYA